MKQLMTTAVVIALAAIVMGEGPCAQQGGGGIGRPAAPVAQTSGAIPGSFQKLVIQGDEAKSGIGDASVEYGPDGVGWMSYSRVVMPIAVDTHIAKSTDHGKTWRYVGNPNVTSATRVMLKGKQADAYMRYETSSLLYDSSDSGDRHWKLFVERYPTVPPHKPDLNLHGDGVIEMRWARTPEGPWSRPVCILGKGRDCVADPNELHPDLRGMGMYNEIGSIEVNGVIYLSLDASAAPSGLGEWQKRRIILVSSRDHGRSWQYTGTLTHYDDANALGYWALTASSLVRVGNTIYLLVTPTGAKGFGKKNRRHDGALVIPFEDITTARLMRDARGTPVVKRHIQIFLNSGGQSDYDEQNTNGGVVFSQMNFDAKPEFFQVYQSRQPLLP